MIKYHLYGYGNVNETFYASSDEEAIKYVKSKDWRFKNGVMVGYGWYILTKEKI